MSILAKHSLNGRLNLGIVQTHEVDPTVPDWAKQPEKPTYTAEEVGAQPKGDYALKSDIPNLPESVLYTAQELNLDQQAQARENIGAADMDSLIEVFEDIDELKANAGGNTLIGVIDSHYYNFRFLNEERGATMAEIREAAQSKDKDIVIRLDLDNWQGTLQYLGLVNLTDDGSTYREILLFSTIKMNNGVVNTADKIVSGTVQLEYWYTPLDPGEDMPPVAFVNCQFAEINLAPGASHAGSFMRVNEDGMWDVEKVDVAIKSDIDQLTEDIDELNYRRAFPVNITHTISNSYPQINSIEMSRSAADVRTVFSRPTRWANVFSLNRYDADNDMNHYYMLQSYTVRYTGKPDGYQYILNFDNDIPSYIVDCETGEITIDPDWVAPEEPAEPSGPHQQLVTDADGNKVWEEKLAYQFENRTAVMNETAYTGEKTELNKNGTPVLDRSIFSGENFVVICDDTEHRVTSVYSPSLKATVMGNASLAGAGEDTGEPFFIDNTGYNKNSYVYFSTDGEHTLSIFEVVVGYKTLPENFLAKKPFAARIHHNISANIPQLNYIQCSSPSSEIHKVLSQDTDYSNSITLLWYNASESIKFNRALTEYKTDNLGTNKGLRYWLYFGDDIAPYIMDVNADTIIVDPDWVAPEESATKSDIDAISNELDTKQPAGDYALKSDINQLSSKIDGKANAVHAHTIGDINKSPDLNKAGAVSAINSAKIDVVRACRTAFMPADAITVEYTQDGGSTWTDYEATDNEKMGLFSLNRAWAGKLGKTGTAAIGYGLRITVTPTDRYTAVDSFYCWFNSCGHKTNLKIERSSIGNPTTFTTVRENLNVDGWSGSNDIGFAYGTFGGGVNQNSNHYAYRFTFLITQINASYTSLPTVTDLRMYGDNTWSTPNNMMLCDHIYGWDNYQNVTFPATITAPTFSGSLSGNATSATKATQDSAGNVITDTYVTKSYVNQLIDAKLASIINAEEVSY